MRAALLLVAAALPAQVVRVNNATAHAWDGWLRVELPAAVPYRAAWTDNHRALLVAADEPGHVDLRVAVPPCGSVLVPLAAFRPCTRPWPRLHDLGDLYAGQLLVGGTGPTFALPEVDGAGITLRGHLTPQPGVLVTVSARWYEDQPYAVAVTARVVASDPFGLPTPLASPLSLSWGDALVWVGPGGSGVLLPAGFPLPDMQPLELRATLVWPRLYTRATDRQAAAAIHAGGISYSVSPE